jgi:hypothetical protein
MHPTAIFEFSRDWTHASVTYAKGGRAELPVHEAEKLERLGAGQVVSPKPDAAAKAK